MNAFATYFWYFRFDGRYYYYRSLSKSVVCPAF